MGMLLQSRLPGSSKAADTTRLAEQYAQFKGRGRYGKAAAAALPAPVATTANPVKYDEVVRGRDKRKHLHAEDCECCHEYYESAKPQPQRLQRPLWRSPKAKGMMDAVTTVAIASNEETRENVEAHKHTISRHRHVWQAPQTPPGYWDISFPTTQEVAEINQEALSRRR
ncbi:hypothetical protein EUX98_g9006 [Antrodiella citrinella]|uniref:DNA endonuclease activator Ctp1 C-terminal domain-containing protein n=1 Tax=Antrodiella citrinella TaxID=2447956 RepID=A0A4S4LZI5_9APHY|nr:hypothetical protein EUX98_g9006 [Antrodiella citrinella]